MGAMRDLRWKKRECVYVYVCVCLPGSTDTGARIRKLLASLDRTRPVMNVTVWKVLPSPISSPGVFEIYESELNRNMLKMARKNRYLKFPLYNFFGDHTSIALPPFDVQTCVP